MKKLKQQRRKDAKKNSRVSREGNEGNQTSAPPSRPSPPSLPSREIRLLALDPQSITARRHQLFDVFSSQALHAVESDPAGACRLADAALKALSGQEHEPQTPAPAPSADASPLSRFAEELERAYANDQ